MREGFGFVYSLPSPGKRVARNFPGAAADENARVQRTALFNIVAGLVFKKLGRESELANCFGTASAACGTAAAVHAGFAAGKQPGTGEAEIKKHAT